MRILKFSFTKKNLAAFTKPHSGKVSLSVRTEYLQQVQQALELTPLGAFLLQATESVFDLSRGNTGRNEHLAGECLAIFYSTSHKNTEGGRQRCKQQQKNSRKQRFSTRLSLLLNVSFSICDLQFRRWFWASPVGHLLPRAHVWPCPINCSQGTC